ncbi:restriction endonuclease subunit S [Vibrio diazotrophicus]|uniref:restriction endonuclease subunit S n=1 Tax=Vibrio diazotrophicus TaxID=685 RepID=UPI000C9E895A|nr:restriction endonuclease subunit S [Vibrio diazotrophicus]PNH92555.1 restriction endonuclease [Vibrio diazotrophicus]
MSVDQALMNQLITDHIDTWTSTMKTKSTAGRGSSKKLELYGVKKLRELILELAVRGKLVPQDPNDEPASVLLERIAKEKALLVKEKKINKSKPLSKFTKEDEPFVLPLGWAWSRLGNTGICATGKTPSTKQTEFFEGTLPFVGPGQITQNGQLLEAEKFLSSEGLLNSTEAVKGDILMVCIGGSIGKAAIATQTIGFNQQINALRPMIMGSHYLYSAVSTSSFYEGLLDKATGSATPIINRGKWEELLVPIAPLPEQHRIVAKVDELMTLCDQLEQQTEASIEAHQVLVTTLLDTLANSANAEELMQNWQMIAEHFDTLFTTIDSIDQLKQTILQLAVMGKLVPQDPNDEPAAKLLERIAEEKDQLIKDKKIKKQQALPPIAGDEKPFELPNGWEWVRLGNLINLISGQHLKPTEYSEAPLDNGTPYITGPAEFGVIYPSFSKYTNETRALASDGDILITCKGAGLGKLNRSNQTLAISRQLMAIQSICVDQAFLFAVLDSKYDYFQSKGVGIAIPGISREDVTELIVALPPASEQTQIVSKLTEITDICNHLKTQLNGLQTTQLILSDAIVELAV